MRNLRKIEISAFLVVLTLIALSQPSNVQAADIVVIGDLTKSFLTDVAGIDIDKYQISLESNQVSYPEEYGGLPQERIRYILETTGSKLDATCVFVNKTFLYGILSWKEGEPIYTESQSVDELSMAEKLLERYQAFSGNLRIQPMKQMLSSLEKAENIDTRVGDLRLRIATGNAVDIQWTYITNGVETWGPEIIFREGKLWSFNDRWNIFSIGSTETTIAKEEAITIALEKARTFSWESNGTIISDFEIAEETPMANFSMNVREPLSLYPFWTVSVWLDKPYNGVDTIAVGLWADTGEVKFVRAISHGGVPINENMVKTSELSFAGILPTVLIAIILTAVAAIAIIMFTKKRRKHWK